jgi:protein-tyrosine-phosphatase
MDPKYKSVLFVCSLNSIRSPMAEGLMKERYGTQAYIQSCGLEAGELNDLMVAVMREKNIDMSGHSSKSLAELSDTSFDVVIAFTEDVEAAVLAVFDDSDTEILLWPTPDPTLGAMDVRAMMNNYRAVRDNINMRIEQKFGKN